MHSMLLQQLQSHHSSSDGAPSSTMQSPLLQHPQRNRSSRDETQRPVPSPALHGDAHVHATTTEILPGDGRNDTNILNWDSPTVSTRRQHRSENDYEQCYSPAELDEIDKSGSFHIPSDDDTRAVFTKCAADLRTANDVPCAACEMAFAPHDVHAAPLTADLLRVRCR